MYQINPKLLKGIPRKIKEVKLDESAQVMELTGLNLKSGKTYELIICEYSTTNSNLGHLLKINNITEDSNSKDSGYKGNCIVAYRNEESHDFGPIINGKGLAYTNGWVLGTCMCFTKVTLEFFNKNWIGCQAHLSGSSHVENKNVTVTQSGQLLSPEGIEAIHTIGIYPVDEDLIGEDSYMILYEK